MTRIRKREPAFLEELVLELLTAMGHGGREGAAEHLGQSGDQGLDGVIRQDALGLDRVYVQAKRYSADRSIGRPDIQGFVGALHGAQALDLEDDELIRLLDALNDTLIIDGESVWRIAARVDRVGQENDPDGPRQRFEGIDWEMLRRHPKVAQYTAGSDYEVGGLQLLLSSITDHFRGLGSPSPARSVSEPDEDADFGSEDLQGLLGDDIDVEAVEHPPELEKEDSRGPAPRRHQNAFKRFIRRYLKGVEDPAFLELVGAPVMADNFTIFNAILTRLPTTGLVPDERFCLESKLRLWELWWGDEETHGVLAELEDEELLFTAERFTDSAVDVAIVRAVAQASTLCADNHWHPEHVRLRNLWRRMLTSPVLTFTRSRGG